MYAAVCSTLRCSCILFRYTTVAAVSLPDSAHECPLAKIVLGELKHYRIVRMLEDEHLSDAELAAEELVEA